MVIEILLLKLKNSTYNSNNLEFSDVINRSHKNLSKTYAIGHKSLEKVSLEIVSDEIFALLGLNGAGKTTLISTICGILSPSSGSMSVGGFDIIADYRKTRSLLD